jgi:hypothetical protein
MKALIKAFRLGARDCIQLHIYYNQYESCVQLISCGFTEILLGVQHDYTSHDGHDHWYVHRH